MAVAKTSKEAHKIKINDSVTKFVHNSEKDFLKCFLVLLSGLWISTYSKGFHTSFSRTINLAISNLYYLSGSPRAITVSIATTSLTT